MTVTVYTRPDCSACRATKVYLRKYGIGFAEVDVSVEPAAAAYVGELGYASLPVIVAGERHWSGFQIDKLKSLACVD